MGLSFGVSVLGLISLKHHESGYIRGSPGFRTQIGAILDK
jgi:hypothetical protein